MEQNPLWHRGLIGTGSIPGSLNLKTTFRQDVPEGALATSPGLDWKDRQAGGRSVVLQLSPELACLVSMLGKSWRDVLMLSPLDPAAPRPWEISVLSKALCCPQGAKAQIHSHKGAELGLHHLVVALRNTTGLPKVCVKGCRSLDPSGEPAEPGSDIRGSMK